MLTTMPEGSFKVHTVDDVNLQEGAQELSEIPAPVSITSTCRDSNLERVSQQGALLNPPGSIYTTV